MLSVSQCRACYLSIEQASYGDGVASMADGVGSSESSVVIDALCGVARRSDEAGTTRGLVGLHGVA